MKLVTMAGTLILILVAAVAVQGLVLQRRAKKIGNLEYSLQKAETSLVEERKRGEIYRARVEELQVQNDALQIRLAADAGKVRQAAADNPQWALQPLPSDVAVALEGLDK